MNPPVVDAVVLAAGSSSRLGQPKQSIRLHDETLLDRTVTTALACVSGEVHVVLGAGASTLLPELEKRPVRPHIYEQWQRGQQSSLLFGLAQTAPDRAVLILLTDQYRVTPAHIHALVQAWLSCPSRPAAASYTNTLGVPVVWPREYVEPLRAASRAQGLLQPDTCTVVPMAAAAYDLDTPEQLDLLREFERGAVG
ncbi:MAG: NTP transferase domain-containing protein [Gammaproteobacteria bacterium]